MPDLLSGPVDEVRATTPARSVTAAGGPPRIGFFGLLGSGNIGNDGSLDVALTEVLARHPDAQIGFFCAGADVISARYGLPAARLNWYRREYETASGPLGLVLKAVGKLIDIVRTADWVRRFDVVIVPGMGVLAADLPVRPWGFPYSMFLLSMTGRLFRTKVAFVSVGSDTIQQSATRKLYVTAAKWAAYRSYRDRRSRDALAAMGVDTSRDRVFPDLVFALPTPEVRPAAPTRTVAVGIMDYHGGNDDRQRAHRLHADYLDAMKRLVRWLVVEKDFDVRLLTGDRADENIARDIVRDSVMYTPSARHPRVSVDPPQSLGQLMQQLAPVQIVVAMRYHNVLCALKMLKPTVSIAYAAKNDELLAGVGLGRYCQSADKLDFDLLVKQVADLESRQDLIRTDLELSNQRFAEQVHEQFDDISKKLITRRRRGAGRGLGRLPGRWGR